MAASTGFDALGRDSRPTRRGVLLPMSGLRMRCAAPHASMETMCVVVDGAPPFVRCRDGNTFPNDVLRIRHQPSALERWNRRHPALGYEGRVAPLRRWILPPAPSTKKVLAPAAARCSFSVRGGGKNAAGCAHGAALASLGMIVGVAVIIKGEDVILGNSKLCLLPKQIEHSFTQLLGAESFSGRCVGSSRSHPGTRPDPRSNGSSKRLNGSRRFRRRVLCAARPSRPRGSRSSCSRTAFASSIPRRWCATSFVARRTAPRSRPPQRKHPHRPTVMPPARKNPS